MKYPILSKILPIFILLILAAFFFTGLVMLIKYFLITLSGLSEPVIKGVKLILSEEKIKNELIFQITTICKVFSLLISGGFIFIIYSALLAVFSCIFYNFCSRNYKKISHPLKFSIIRGIKWNFYRVFLVLAPPLSVKTMVGFLIISSVILFNFLLKVAGVSISLTAFLVSFITFSMMFLFIISLFVSFWQFSSTLFGTEIAVSEPRLKNKIIAKRSKKLIISGYYNILLCISSFVLIYSIIFQIKYALTTDLLTNPANQQFLNFFIVFNLFCLIAFEYLKASGYINSLIKYNEKISKCPIKAIKV